MEGQQKRLERCSSLAHALFGYPSANLFSYGFDSLRIRVALCFAFRLFPEGFVIIINPIALVKRIRRQIRINFRFWTRRNSRPAFSSGGIREPACIGPISAYG